MSETLLPQTLLLWFLQLDFDFSMAQTGRLDRIEGGMMEAKYREVLGKTKTLLYCKWPETGVMVHLSEQQWTEAYSQDNTGMASGQVSVCRWVIHLKSPDKPHRIRMETPEGGNSQMTPIQSDDTWGGCVGKTEMNCPNPDVQSLKTRRRIF